MNNIVDYDPCEVHNFMKFLDNASREHPLTIEDKGISG